MKKKLLLCSAAAALLAVLALLLPEHSILVIALPFQWAGKGLRLLSLSGKAGNVLAILLYLFIGLLPMLLAVKQKWSIENWLLPASCGILMYVLYYMINPGLRPLPLQNDVGSLILSGCFYSLLLSWGVIRLLRYSDTMEASAIHRALRIFLWICLGECIWIGALSGIRRLTSSLVNLSAQNTMPGLSLFPTQLMMILAFCVTAAEYLLDAWAIYLAISLLHRIEVDPYGEECCAAAARAVRFCRCALIAIVLSHTVLNLLNMFLAPFILHLDASFRLPILSMAIIFAILALSRLLNQGRLLKEDNDLFI